MNAVVSSLCAGALLVALAGVLCALSYEDIRTRLISVRLLVAMVSIRVLFAFLGFVASINTIFLAVVDAMSFCALAVSCACAFVVMGLLKAAEAIAKIVCNLKAGVHQPVSFLGTGDVLLIGACCLFLTPYQAGFFLLLSMGFGVVWGLYYLVRHGDNTFPFAPAIALAFGVVCCVRLI